MKTKLEIVELPDKCKGCAMRRHRIGIVRECAYECPAEDSLSPEIFLRIE